ncbi:MAG: response regulator [Planctomycetes bacterium]|nr:response regulator [Planctomycetota bacterium]MCP4770356.1 response regulator [Planctomycetota bacterium]MCP4861963.1 response regulator [Planctomycetota bacterium]
MTSDFPSNSSIDLGNSSSAQARITELEGQLEQLRRETKVLRESESQHRTWLEKSPVCTKILDLNFKLQYMSQAGISALCIPDIEEYYQTPYPPEFFSPRFKVTMLEALRKVRDEEVVAHQEAPLKSLNGTLIWFRSTLFPLYDDDGNFESIMVVSTDITPRVKAEEERALLERQLLHAQKLESLGVLAGGIAHDFNNILVGILGNADLALRGLSEDNPSRENIAEIKVASHRAAELSEQMLAYSGKGKFLIESIDLGEFLVEMTHLLDVALSKKVELRLDIADSLPHFAGDPTQIRQVIMNLITNASEAIGEGNGRVTLAAGSMECDQAYLDDGFELLVAGAGHSLDPGSYVYCEVTDSGCGMDAETVSKVFEPFFTTKFTGRGLGMAAVLGIVRGHRGAIKVRSQPKKGTTFRVLFPAGTQVPETVVTPSNVAKPGADWRGSGTVLIADDEDLVCNVGKEMLKHFGFKALQAKDGLEALQVFREHANDITCVLLDLTMPQMDGEQVFLEMRKLRPDVKVILTSGYSMDDLSQRFAGKGLAGFLQKPFNLENLRNVLAPVVG